MPPPTSHTHMYVHEHITLQTGNQDTDAPAHTPSGRSTPDADHDTMFQCNLLLVEVITHCCSTNFLTLTSLQAQSPIIIPASNFVCR